MESQHGPRRVRGSKDAPGPESRSALRRLVAAGLLFGLCAVGKLGFPQQTAQWQRQLSALMSGSGDLRQAFGQLGEQLEERQEVFGAVGDWCVNVFGPEGLTLPKEEG